MPHGGETLQNRAEDGTCPALPSAPCLPHCGSSRRVMGVMARPHGPAGEAPAPPTHGTVTRPSSSAGSSRPPAPFQAGTTNLLQARYPGAAVAGAGLVLPLAQNRGCREHSFSTPAAPSPMAAGLRQPSLPPRLGLSHPAPRPAWRGVAAGSPRGPGSSTVGHMAIAPRVDNVAQRLF